MRNNKLFLIILAAFSLFIGSGCASSVRCKYIVPSMKYNEPYALITETGLRSGYTSSTIKGFYTSETDYQELEEPVNIDSAGDLVLKGYYSLTPFGWATHAIHHKKGRRIRVPEGKLGICIAYRYYKEISRTYSHSDSEYDYYVIKYDSSEWEHTIWETVKAREKYTLDLMGRKLFSSKDKKHKTTPSEAPAPPQNVETKTEEVATDSSGNVKDTSVPSENSASTAQDTNNTESSISADDQEIIDAGVKKAKELGANPVPICEDEDGNKVIPAGFMFHIVNGKHSLKNGDMLINVTNQTITAIDVPLLRGEYAVIKNNKAQKGDGKLVSK